MIDPTVVARDLYDLDGSATPLPGEHDHNFRLDVNGARYVLKVHRPARTSRSRTPCSSTCATSPRFRGWPGRRRASGDRVVRLLTWLDGHPWADAPGDLDEPGPHRRAGRSRAGRLRASRRCAATTRGTCATRPTSGSRSRRSTISPTRSSTTTPTSTTCWSPTTAPSTGLIDFGDVVWTARVCGLAVAGAYAMQGQPDPGSRGRRRRARLPRGHAAARRTSSRCCSS